MNERTLVERLNIPWPEHEAEEVTLPAWVLELCTEGAARITALEAENERLKEALTAIDKIITSSIQENGRPHRLKIGDVWHIGPAVDALHSILMGLRTVARSALTAAGGDASQDEKGK